MARDEEKKKSGFATAALVLGIIGICTSFIPIVNNASFVLGVLAVIFAIIPLIKKASTGKAIVSIILGILAVVITLSSQKALSDSFDELSNELDRASGGSTQEVLANDVDVSFGEFEVIEGDYGLNDTKLTVKLTNKTSETRTFSLQVEAVNNNGERITQDYIYANNLTAGQSQSFDIFTYVSNDILEEMKNATFNVVEASSY